MQLRERPGPQSKEMQQSMWCKKEREKRGGRGREGEREKDLKKLITSVIDKHVCFFYIQPLPKQGTTLDLITHVNIF